MTFILTNKLNEFIKVDFTQGISSGWCSSIHETELGFIRNNGTVQPWSCAEYTPNAQLNYILDSKFTTICIDNIPFAKWCKLNPEYVI